MPQPFGVPHSESRTNSSIPFVSFPFGLAGGVDYVDDRHGIGGLIDEIVEDVPHDKPGADALCLEFANEISAHNSRPSSSARSRIASLALLGLSSPLPDRPNRAHLDSDPDGRFRFWGEVTRPGEPFARIPRLVTLSKMARPSTTRSWTAASEEDPP